MAKKKATGADGEEEKEEAGDLNSKLSKEWKGKFLSGGELQDNSLTSISTSSVKLDWALGGLYEGSIVELYGDNATGKSTFSLEVASNAIKLGKKVYYVDLERKLREAQINMIRDLDKAGLSIMYPDTAEEALNMMEEVVRSVPGCVVILDSVSGLLPEVEDAEDASKVTMGTVAKFCAKMIRKLTGIACKNKCLLLFLNHKTASMQMYGPSDTVHGGKAISNRASQRIELSRTMGQLIKGPDGETVIGQVVKCKVVKNNVKRPFITVEVPIIYGQGIARELDTFEFAVELNVIDGTKKGWYGWKDQSLRKDEVLLKLLQDEAFKKEVVDEIKKVMH